MILVLTFFAVATGLTFGAIAADVNVSKDGASASTTITSPVFTTSAANEQVLAFISTDYLSGSNTTVKSVTGAGLTWTLVKRTNAQSGSSEIWGAFASVPLTGVTVTATLSQSVVSSITVMSFAGVNPTGAIGAVGGNSAASGAPTATLVTTGSNSLVVGVGNDYDNAIARTVGAGQTLIHQDLTATGDTYWVQMQASSIPASGTTVSINDTAPTKDRYNLSIVEILAAVLGPPTYSISGTIAPSAGGSGATVALGGTSSATTVADANGNYSFTGLANGSYTVTPSKTGFTFTPANQSVTVNGANQTAVNFTAQAIASWSISGTVSPATSGAGATLVLSGASSATTVADANGNYSFTGLANGSYTVTPSKTGFTFTPANQSVTVNGANQTAVNFTAQAVASWSISGTVSPATSGAGATLVLSGASSATTVADANGNYSFTGLANGSYTLKPSKTGFTFTPANQSVTVNGANQTAVNFTAQAIASWSISGTVSPVTSGAGATLVLSGASSATTVADASGNYSFTGLANGSYTVTPSKTGFTFTPGNHSVTINGANQTGVNFTAQATAASGAISRDVTVSQDGASASTTITSPVFTTSAANEQVLAFISTDYLSGSNTTVKSVTGAGLTWTLVKRTNAQSGSSEIWGAFASVPLTSVTVTATLSQSVISSMTVMSFAGR